MYNLILKLYISDLLYLRTYISLYDVMVAYVPSKLGVRVRIPVEVLIIIAHMV